MPATRLKSALSVSIRFRQATPPFLPRWRCAILMACVACWVEDLAGVGMVHFVINADPGQLVACSAKSSPTLHAAGSTSTAYPFPVPSFHASPFSAPHSLLPILCSPFSPPPLFLSAPLTGSRNSNNLPYATVKPTGPLLCVLGVCFWPLVAAVVFVVSQGW
jgi:hypothetical protein